MLSPAISLNQHRAADFWSAFDIGVAPGGFWGMLQPAGGAVTVSGFAAYEGDILRPAGQRSNLPALVLGILGMRPFRRKASNRKSNREPYANQSVGQLEFSSKGTGTCRFAILFSRLAQQLGWPLAATPLPSKVLAALPSAQALLRLLAVRWHRVQRLAPQPTSVTASLTPASAKRLILAVPPRIRVGGTAFPSIFSGTAQPRLTRLFALPVTVKGTADV